MKVFLILKMCTSLNVGGKEEKLTPVNGIHGFAPVAIDRESAIAFCNGVDGQYLEVEIPDGSLPT